MTIQNQGFDPEFAQIIHRTGDHAAAPLEGMNWLIDRGQNLVIDREKKYKNDLPTLIEVASRIYDSFMDYHKQILKGSSQWSNDLKIGIEKTMMFLLYPFSIFQIGEAFRVTIAKKFLGNIAKLVSFVAFQIFHLLPYFLIGTVFKVLHILYLTAPVALLTGLAGTMLSSQIYLIYRLVKEIEISNKILIDSERDLNRGVNYIKLISTPFKPLYWCYSIPKRLITYCVLGDKKA